MKNITAIILLTSSAILSGHAAAADIQVQVYERGGKAPLAGAAVCAGTSARLDQFGARKTDATGKVTFSNIPRTTVAVTVSQDGYKSEQETIVNSAGDRTLVMSLSPGGGGPACQLAAADSATTSSGLVINRFVINDGKSTTNDRRVQLNNSVSGQATQYRASERADFGGAQWQDYSAAPTFELSPDKGRKLVYFQVRRHANVNGAVIETLSPVSRDAITLQ